MSDDQKPSPDSSESIRCSAADGSQLPDNPGRSADIKEINADTWSMICTCVLLSISGIVLACVEGPQFHHGLMIGVGATMVLVSSWRRKALISNVK